MYLLQKIPSENIKKNVRIPLFHFIFTIIYFLNHIGMQLIEKGLKILSVNKIFGFKVVIKGANAVWLRLTARYHLTKTLNGNCCRVFKLPSFYPYIDFPAAQFVN